MEIRKTILIVEDEAAIRDMLCFALTQQHFKCLSAESAQHAKYVLAENIVDLILLDWMLPGMSGIQFAQNLKNNEQYRNIPIIMLTARAEEDCKVRGLEIGVDDYITKPFSPRELTARIKAVLRRGPLLSTESQLLLSGIRLDLAQYKAYVGEIELTLRPKEFRLLQVLMTQHRRAVSREQLLYQLSQQYEDTDTRAVDTQIRRLRQVLAKHGIHDCIRTVRHVGYQFIEKPSC